MGRARKTSTYAQADRNSSKPEMDSAVGEEEGATSYTEPIHLKGTIQRAMEAALDMDCSEAYEHM